MTDYLSKISQRVRDNAKAWFEQAGLPEGVDEKTSTGATSQAAIDKAFENLKLLSSLYAEGVPAREVSALNIVFAANPRVKVTALIQVARDKRNDPALKPWLTLLKETLLPLPPSPEEQNGIASPELVEKRKKHNIEAAKLVYESGAVANTLLKHIGIIEKDNVELQSSVERYESALGRKLNDEEKFA